MELNSDSIHDVIHPTAAFSQSQTPQQSSQQAIEENPSWLESQLNPQARIDSLEAPQNPLWRIDGCTGLGTQYYAIPLFLGAVPPLRFDVFIPEEAGKSPVLRRLLDLNAAFHTKDSARVRRLGISRHILRTLQAWTLSGTRESVAQVYKDLPFGSRIIFENLDLNIRNIKITIAPMHNLEKQLLKIANIANRIGLPADVLPEPIDIHQLELVQQLHDSVCVVRLNNDKSQSQDKSSRNGERLDDVWIFKTLTSGTKYLYRELQNLLRLESHPHVISRPRYLVTKYCQFGGKTAVVGFLIPYHSAGSLRDTLPLLRMHGQLTLDLQLKWAVQLASALSHIREQGRIFYPDLRLDNVVLSDSGDIIMVDFEQRGVWCEFAAPEVNALEYTRILASDESLANGEDATEPLIPEEVRNHFSALLTRELPDWEALQEREDYCKLPHGYESYNVAWECLSPAEQEAAEVYMFGRVLWCIFEGQSAPQRAAVWQSYRFEPEIEFPTFRQTHPGLRDLINRCTKGRREVLSSLVVRSGSKLVLRTSGSPDDSGNAADQADPSVVLQAAKDWWSAEVKVAEEFLQMRHDKKKRGEWNDNYYGRPTMRGVLADLRAFQEKKLVV